MKLLFKLIAVSALAVAWTGPADAQRKPPPKPVNGAEHGVYLKAALPLDEPRHLCLDIPGHGGRVNVKRDLSVHSCKEGIWNLDERFVKSAISSGDLKMPQYNLCVAAREAKTGSKVGLVACGSTKLAKWEYKEARLTLAGHSNLCLTIGPEPSALTPGGQRLPSRNKARSVGIDTCSGEAIERQLWTFADPLNITKPLMPPKGK
jgi:hypothetical protein